MLPCFIYVGLRVFMETGLFPWATNVCMQRIVMILLCNCVARACVGIRNISLANGIFISDAIFSIFNLFSGFFKTDANSHLNVR